MIDSKYKRKDDKCPQNCLKTWQFTNNSFLAAVVASLAWLVSLHELSTTNTPKHDVKVAFNIFHADLGCVEERPNLLTFNI